MGVRVGVLVGPGVEVCVGVRVSVAGGRGVPVPVILVGAQRSSDRPSSDAYLNLIAAVSVAARAEFSGVYAAMHADPSDRIVAVHHGTRLRKNSLIKASISSFGIATDLVTNS